MTAGVMLRVNSLEPCLPMDLGLLSERVVKIRFFGFEMQSDGLQGPGSGQIKTIQMGEFSIGGIGTGHGFSWPSTIEEHRNRLLQPGFQVGGGKDPAQQIRGFQSR